MVTHSRVNGPSGGTESWDTNSDRRVKNRYCLLINNALEKTWLKLKGVQFNCESRYYKSIVA